MAARESGDVELNWRRLLLPEIHDIYLEKRRAMRKVNSNKFKLEACHKLFKRVQKCYYAQNC